MTSAIRLGAAPLRSVLSAAQRSDPETVRPEVHLLLGALFALVPCDWVSWSRVSASPIASAIESMTYPATATRRNAAAARFQLRLDLAHPTGVLQVLTICRGVGPPFSQADQLVLGLLEPHLRTALRRIGFPSPRLTAREIEVLRCVRDGMANAQIARQLHVAESTVVKHLEHVFSRSGAHSRTEAVRLCEPALG